MLHNFTDTVFGIARRIGTKLCVLNFADRIVVVYGIEIDVTNEYLLFT